MKFLSLTMLAVFGFAGVAMAATAIHNGTVQNVPAGQYLNCRVSPNATAAAITQFSNGDPIVLLGKCKNPLNGGSTFTLKHPPTSAANYLKMKKPNVWCEALCDNPHTYGWVRGTFVWPQ